MVKDWYIIRLPLSCIKSMTKVGLKQQQ